MLGWFVREVGVDLDVPNSLLKGGLGWDGDDAAFSMFEAENADDCIDVQPDLPANSRVISGVLSAD